MTLWSSLGGMYAMKLISADPSGALQALYSAGVVLLDPQMTDELTWCFHVSRADGEKVVRIAEKRGEQWQICGRRGIFWSLLTFRKRPVLIGGLIALLALSCWMPNRVLFVQVVGNEEVSARQIAEELSLCGVSFGTSSKQIRSQTLKDQLLDRLPQLQWAGVEISGCVAVITVKERAANNVETEPDGVYSIVASRDAVIAQMVVTRGTSLCQVGQAVKSGQTLISGYTDCGICIRADRADGQIWGMTQRTISAVFPLERENRTEIRGVEKKYSLIIGKKQINFFKDSGILDMSCAKIYEEKYVTLPGGFQLPVLLMCEQWIYYDTNTSQTADPEELLKILARQYVLRQTAAGKIAHTQEYVTYTNGCARLMGVYGCLENIGMARMEESLPNYGKSDGKNR